VVDLEWTLAWQRQFKEEFSFLSSTIILTIQMSLNAIANVLIALITHYFVAPPVAPLLLTAPPAPAFIAVVVPVDPFPVSCLFVPFLFPFDRQSFGNSNWQSRLLVGCEWHHQVWYYHPLCHDD